MTLRLLHTSDWHLGHTLHGVGREYEHARFLAWLLDRLESEAPDALLITGDVYETATPPARAERAFFDFLAEARRRRPDLDVVVIGGNHDSAQRLEAPAALLRALGVHVVASLPRGAGGEPEVADLVAPLTDAAGAVAAWVAAVPFLRPTDLPAPRDDAADPLIDGVARVYAAALAAAGERRAPGQALLATGHCYMTGATLSELSERRILGGNQHALPVDLFPEDVAYAALGHLHRPQTVGERVGVRYAGSPIPLSLSEVDYPHQVVRVDLEGERLAAVAPLLVPRAVEVRRVPASEPAPLDDVLALLEALPERDPEVPAERRPLLEVRVRVEAPEPGLRRRVEEALAGKAPRLVKLAVERSDAGASLADAQPQARLAEIEPGDVFRRCYRRRYPEQEPPAAWVEAFAELAAAVARGEEEPAAPTPEPEPAAPAAALAEPVRRRSSATGAGAGRVA